MSERADFHVTGQPLDGTPLHYTASGLNYVYLLNGFTVENDPDYGRIITIQNERDLHRAIGLYVITRPRTLTGAEFRFLRKQMGFKQKDLAGELGINEQTVANYEKDRPIPTASDHLMRLEFLLWITPKDANVDLVKRIAETIKARARKQPKPTAAATAAAAVTMPPADIQSSISNQWQVQAGVGKMKASACHVY
jgi:transcriptional regulator with XRE-family HTH domain